MVLPPSTADARCAAPWLGSIARQLARAQGGLVCLACRAHPAQLGPAVKTLVRAPPWAGSVPALHVCLDVQRLAKLPQGARVLLRVQTREDARWLNLHRPLVAVRALRILLWADEEATDHLFREAVDFSDWISRVVEVPPALAPPFALEGLRAALSCGAPILWRGAKLPQLLAELTDSPPLNIDASAPYRSLVEQLQRPGIAVVHNLTREYDRSGLLLALADTARRDPWIVLDPEIEIPGLWHLHAIQRPWHSAAAALDRAGWQQPALVAAWLGLEPELVDAAAKQSSPAAFELARWSAAEIAEATAPAFVLRHRSGDPEVLEARQALPTPALRGLDSATRNLAMEVQALGDAVPSQQLIDRLATLGFSEIAMEFGLRRVQQGLFDGLNKLVPRLIEYGHLAEARRIANKAVANAEQQLSADPHSAQAKRDLSVSLDNLGNLEVAAGNLLPARDLFARSLELLERLASADPHSAQAKRDLATSYERMATVEETRATEWLARAVAIRQTCLDTDPTNATVTHELAFSLIQLGAALSKQGDNKKATSHLKQAHRLLEDLRTRGALEPRYFEFADSLAQMFS